MSEYDYGGGYFEPDTGEPVSDADPYAPFDAADELYGPDDDYLSSGVDLALQDAGYGHLLEDDPNVDVDPAWNPDEQWQAAEEIEALNQERAIVPQVAGAISQLDAFKGRGRAGAEAAAMLAGDVAARGEAVAQELVTYFMANGHSEQSALEALAPIYGAIVESATESVQARRAMDDALAIIGSRRPNR
jgi:hypothetical protein